MTTTTTTTTARVLMYVEDDPAHAELVMRTLDDHQIPAHVVHFGDGEAALAYLAQARGADRPALVLLDLRLPRVDGIEVLEHIKADPELQRIPVVVLTTSRHPDDVRRAYARHANSYLVKPTDLPGLDGLVHELGRYWMQRNVESP